MMTAVIRKEILRDKIHAVLKDWILKGELKPGERIVEYVVARRLQVSRAPMREALWLLAHEGLVRMQAHHGAFVTRLSPREIREVFEIRELLETHAARKIRALLTPASRKSLESALRALEEAARARSIPRFSQADLAYHKTLWTLAGNAHLEEMLGEVSTRFFAYEMIRDLPNSERFRFDAVFDEHRRMTRAILQGTDHEIEAVFRKSFAEFLSYVLSRFGEEKDGA
jgi:DNA-binding GntR family transcriptional regulator